MGLGPAYDNTVIPALYHTEKHILVRLFVGGQGAIPFHVRHTGVCRQVILLHIFQELDEVVVIVRPMFLVHIVSNDSQRREAIEPRTSLVACPDPIPQLPVELYPRHEIINARWGQGKPIDRFIDQWALGNRKIAKFIQLGHFIRCSGCLNSRAEPRVVYHIGDLSPNIYAVGFICRNDSIYSSFVFRPMFFPPHLFDCFF